MTPGGRPSLSLNRFISSLCSPFTQNFGRSSGTGLGKHKDCQSRATHDPKGLPLRNPEPIVSSLCSPSDKTVESLQPIALTSTVNVKLLVTSGGHPSLSLNLLISSLCSALKIDCLSRLAYKDEHCQCQAAQKQSCIDVFVVSIRYLRTTAALPACTCQ